MKRWYVLLGLALVLFVSGTGLAQTPPAPKNLTAELVPTSVPVVKLQWEVPPVMSMMRIFYKVNRSIDDSLHFDPLDVTDGGFYYDHRVEGGHTYFYTVSAFWFIDSSVVEGPPSNIAWVTIGPPVPHPHGIVQGTVTDSVSGQPLPFVHILFYRKFAGWTWFRQTWTDLNGKYAAILDTGTYLVKAQPMFFAGWWMFPISIYQPEWFDDAMDIAHATPVGVADSSVFTADFDLLRVPPPVPAKVSGTVTDTSGTPVKGALVVFFRPMGEIPMMTSGGMELPGQDEENFDFDDLGRLGGVLRKTLTDSLGHYSISLLAGRSYIAMAVKRGFLPQFFDHKADPRDADVIKLGGDTTGIDFSLTPRPIVVNSIAGMVRDSSGTGVASRIVLIPLGHGLGVRFGSTDSMGQYLISGVRAGSYFVLAIPLRDYAPAFYKAGAYGVMQWQQADTVSISGVMTGIDIGVVPFGGSGAATVSGIVQSQGTGLTGVAVFATDASGSVIGYALTDNTGAFTITGVPTGSISLLANREGYTTGQGSVNVGPTDYILSAGNITLDPTTVLSVGGPGAVPFTYALDQNYPNPFNPSTKISFSVATVSNVRLTVFNVLGQEVATLVSGVLPAGRYDATWQGKDNAGHTVSSGVYFYRFEASSVAGGNTFADTRKMVLLK